MRHHNAIWRVLFQTGISTLTPLVQICVFKLSVLIFFLLCYYMGNLIVTGASIFIPLLNKLVTVPFLFHPYRWGGVPWKAPGDITVMLATFIMNILMLSILATISGMMSTEKECRKHDVWLSFKRSMWAILGYIVGNIVVFLMPLLTAPLLAMFVWLPYAGIIVPSMMVSIFIMLFGAIGNTVLRSNVCT